MTIKTNGPAADPAAVHPAAAVFKAWLDINRPMLSAMQEINGKLLEQAARVNTEWVGFINRRLKEDIATSERLMDCKTMQDVMTAYRDFFERAQQQYQAEFQYFAHLNERIASETASAVNAKLHNAAEQIRH